MPLVWEAIIGALVTVALAWIVFGIVLVLVRPDKASLREAMRLAPDVLRLTKRLATDKSVPRRARFAVWALLVYMVSPIDVIPDFIPVIGFADDIVLLALVLGYLVRKAGPEKLAEHWPGEPEGLAVIQRVLRLG